MNSFDPSDNESITQSLGELVNESIDFYFHRALVANSLVGLGL